MKYLLFILLSITVFGCDPKDRGTPVFTAHLYLKDDMPIDTMRDIRFLRSLSYVERVSFTSKEDAKREYLEDGNQDWTNVLKENPLPNSYEVLINADLFTKKDIEPLKARIFEMIPYCSEVAFPESQISEK